MGDGLDIALGGAWRGSWAAARRRSALAESRRLCRACGAPLAAAGSGLCARHAHAGLRPVDPPLSAHRRLALSARLGCANWRAVALPTGVRVWRAGLSRAGVEVALSVHADTGGRYASAAALAGRPLDPAARLAVLEEVVAAANGALGGGAVTAVPSGRRTRKGILMTQNTCENGN